ncbi:MAG: hypothetical protein G01um101470_980 [Parcubacteria group bacterium Gr01-1014_70]|nr:MAG: hypothetical protein G01um101470_980 [Parcubacteria group bacterium Gr01-1014_70]
MLLLHNLGTRFCPFCGGVLESNGVSERTKEGTREYHLCGRLEPHEVPYVVCEIIELENSRRSLFICRPDGGDVAVMQRWCFLCGSKLHFYCEYSGITDEGEEWTRYMYVCQEGHLWQEIIQQFALYFELSLEDLTELEQNINSSGRGN